MNGQDSGRTGTRTGTVNIVVTLILSTLVGCGCVPLSFTVDYTGTAGSGAGATIEGTWSGNVALTAKMAVSTAGPADIDDPQAIATTVTVPLTITFNVDGIPTAIPFFGVSPGSLQPDALHTTAVLQGQTSTLIVNDLTYTLMVREAAYSRTAAHVVIDATAAYAGESQAALAGAFTQTLDAVLSADGSTVNVTVAGSGTTQMTTTLTTLTTWGAQQLNGSGALTRQ